MSLDFAADQHDKCAIQNLIAQDWLAVRQRTMAEQVYGFGSCVGGCFGPAMVAARPVAPPSSLRGHCRRWNEGYDVVIDRVGMRHLTGASSPASETRRSSPGRCSGRRSVGKRPVGPHHRRVSRSITVSLNCDA